jgi:hypothetical protein
MTHVLRRAVAAAAAGLLPLAGAGLVAAALATAAPTTISSIGVDSVPNWIGVDSVPNWIGVDGLPNWIGVDSVPNWIGVDSVPNWIGVDSLLSAT